METNDFKYPSIRQVQEAYRNANEEQRSLLVKLFGQAAKKERPVTERIKTFEDACNELGENHPFVCAYHTSIEYATSNQDVDAYLKLRIICAALNDGWEPTFDDNEHRYYPYLVLYTKEEVENMDEDTKNNLGLFGGRCGFVAARTYDDFGPADAFLGSRLALKTRELAEYCCKQFIDLLADFYLIRK